MSANLTSLAKRAAGRIDRECRRRLIPSQIQAGAHTYFGSPLPKVTAFPQDAPHPVTIGAYCSIAGGVDFVIGGHHRTNSVSTFPLPGYRGPLSKGPIRVGNDVWIGKSALILSGVTIGDGAVVGAGSVIARDVRPYAIVAGNPARELRRRFDDEQVERLLDAAWWTWPEGEVSSISHLLTGDDVASLLEYAQRRV